MTEILSEVWNGFLMGFKYAGIVMGFAVGAYVAFLLADATWRVLEKITRRD
ncbi:MAG: hypothetical protein IJU98_02675 [Synergistaceae bacterium]|nr:hypothetical protein [Synergistaceae bacterium]